MIKTIQEQNRKASLNNSILADVTSASGNKINAYSAGESREVRLIAPYGVIWLPPVGTVAEIIKNWGRDKHAVAIGVISEDKGISPGECLLYSQGGAKIYMKNDGSVILNDSVQITKDGSSIVLNGNNEVARKGDTVEVNVPGVGTCTGTITSGSSVVKVG